jgi:hypothetical protein
MILDKLFEFCSATALNTGGAATYLLGNVVDLGAAPTLQDVGLGERLWIFINVNTTATSGGSATGDFRLASDSTADLATSPTVHFSSGAVAVATLVAGYTIAAFILPLGNYERYLGITQTTAVAAFTAGKINAFATKDVSKWVSYPNAIGA